jgi:hypothetical protein
VEPLQVPGEALEVLLVLGRDRVSDEDREPGVSPGEQELHALLADQLSLTELAQDLATHQLLEAAPEPLGQPIEGGARRRVEGPRGHQAMQVWVEVQQVSSRLKSHDDSRAHGFGGQAAHELLQTLIDPAREVRQEVAAVLEIRPQHFGEAHDHVLVRNLPDQLLGDPLAEGCAPLG